METITKLAKMAAVAGILGLVALAATHYRIEVKEVSAAACDPADPSCGG